MGDELTRLAARLNGRGGGGYLQAKVARAWKQVTGDRVRSHTVGAHLKDGILVVYVDSPAWATELSALSEGYRTALNQEIGEELVKVMRFSVSRKVDESFRRALEENPGLRDTECVRAEVSIPLTPAERAIIEKEAASIEDVDLREAVIRARVADSERKKGMRAAKAREEASEGP